VRTTRFLASLFGVLVVSSATPVLAAAGTPAPKPVATPYLSAPTLSRGVVVATTGRTVAFAEKPENVQAVPSATAIRSTSARHLTDAPATGTSAASALRLSVAQADPSLQFLTRPYTVWHDITSVFDHCNPDYTTDGRVCKFDGETGVRSNGVDPSFSLGYAQTPGGRDYLSYDGHNGWDYSMYYENVLSTAPGTVTLAGTDSINPCFGQTVLIDHGNGFTTRYAHLSAIYVRAGDPVARGQVIAASGNTGCSSGPHLHFGVYITSSWTAVDPWGWDAAGPDPWPSDPQNLWLTGYAQFPLASAPSNVLAGAGNAAATVSWAAPAFNGGTGIASYNVTSSPGGIVTTVPGTSTTATVIGLTNGTAYTFNVTAINSVGASVSAASNAVTPSASALPVASLSQTSVNFDTQALGSTTTVGIQVVDLSGIALAINSMSATGDYSQTNSCGTSLAPLASCTINVTFRPTATGPRTGSFTITTNGAGSPQTVAFTGVGETWVRTETLGGQLTSGPGVASWGPGRLDVFARGSNNSLIHKWYSNGWWNWESLGGIITSDPAAVSWGVGRIDVFARGGDNALWHRAYASSGWAAWESLGGILTSAPAVASWGTGRLDVFMTGTDSALWHRGYDGTNWQSWESLGGGLAAHPAAVSWSNGRIDIVARGLDNAMWHRWYDAGGWFNWESVGGQFATAPSVASWGPGRLDIFAISAGGALMHAGYDATGWRSWRSLGGRIASDPTAVSWAPGRIDVFATAPDASLWHTWLN
jgi:murein DD-endopeptidase MepM/ murein hydrolase activator NlpD